MNTKLVEYRTENDIFDVILILKSLTTKPDKKVA